MLAFYLKLQVKILNRTFRDWGFHPIIACLFFLSAFFGLSYYLFYKIEYAQFIYPLFAIAILGSLASKNRNEFLQSIFTKLIYYLIRLLENLLLSLPFICFLMINAQFKIAIFLLLISLFMSLLNLKFANNLVIPTLFSKYPFEFTVGFRKTFFLFFCAYALCIIAIKFNNFNLGLFSIVLIALISSSFYLNPEKLFYVWICSDDCKTFLNKKIKVALFYFMILCLPCLVALGIFFFVKILYLALALLFSIMILITAVLSKYSAYPYELNIKKSLAIVISIWLPILFLLLIPYFYLEAKKNLKDILE